MFRFASIVAIVGFMTLGVYGGAMLLFPSFVPALAGFGAVSSVPSTINHQGFVTVSGKRFTGSGSFKFAIVDPDTGNNVWTNDGSKVDPPTQTGEPDSGVTLTVNDGVYSVVLGTSPMTAISPSLFSDGNLVLRVWFNDGTHDWRQISPDQKLSSTPYAMTAEYGVPVGTIIATALSNTPVGWLLCNGASVAKTDYPALFAGIGYTYGGSGNNFNLPDLRGRVITALDNMGGTDAGRLDVVNTLGGSGGEQAHALIISEMPTHNHGVNDSGHLHDMVINHTCSSSDCSGPNGWMWHDGGTGQKYTATATTGISIQNTGSGANHNNMQPYILLNYIIKY